MNRASVPSAMQVDEPAKAFNLNGPSEEAGIGGYVARRAVVVADDRAASAMPQSSAGRYADTLVATAVRRSHPRRSVRRAARDDGQSVWIPGQG